MMNTENRFAQANDILNAILLDRQILQLSLIIRQLQEANAPARPRTRAMEYYNLAALCRRAGQTARADQLKQQADAVWELIEKDEGYTMPADPAFANVQWPGEEPVAQLPALQFPTQEEVAAVEERFSLLEQPLEDCEDINEYLCAAFQELCDSFCVHRITEAMEKTMPGLERLDAEYAALPEAQKEEVYPLYLEWYAAFASILMKKLNLWQCASPEFTKVCLELGEPLFSKATVVVSLAQNHLNETEMNAMAKLYAAYAHFLRLAVGAKTAQTSMYIAARCAAKAQNGTCCNDQFAWELWAAGKLDNAEAMLRSLYRQSVAEYEQEGNTDALEGIVHIGLLNLLFLAEQKQDIAAARSLLAQMQQIAAQDDSLSHEARFILLEADRRWGLPQA